MFFKDIESWTEKQLKTAKLVCLILYYGAILIAPIIIIASRYKLFEKANGYKLSGIGLIMTIVLGAIIFVSIKKTINAMPEIELSEQRRKYTIQTIINLFIPVLSLIALSVAKDNFLLAYSTYKWCIWFVIGAIAFDGLTLRYIDKQLAELNKAKGELKTDRIKANLMSKK